MGNEEAKLFVAGLPDGMSEDILKQLFESTGGKVVNVSLPKDRTTGRPRGFGFVTLATPEEAQAARQALDGSLQSGRSISVRPFQPEPPRREGGFGGPGGPGGPGGGFGGPPSGPRSARPSDDDRKLYVGNLPYDCTQQDIEEVVNTACAGAGQVVNVTLPVGPDGRKKGFGFVTLSSVEAAKAAVNALQSASMRGRPLKVNMAQPKGDRPPRSDGFAGGGGFGGGGGGFGGGGGGGMGFGGPPPPASRKTFDDASRKRKQTTRGSGPGDDGAPRRRGGTGGATGGGRPERGGGGKGNWGPSDDDD